MCCISNHQPILVKTSVQKAVKVLQTQIEAMLNKNIHVILDGCIFT